jgi:hypothetical protein
MDSEPHVGVQKYFVTGPLRQVVFTGSCPTESWRLALFPDSIADSKLKLGVGAALDPIGRDICLKAFFRSFWLVRDGQHYPSNWLCGQTVTAPKGESDERVVGIFDTIAKGFYKQVWWRNTWSDTRLYCFGYTERRRVEHATMAHLRLADRRRHGGVSSHLAIYDMRNALFCGRHDDLDFMKLRSA